MIILDANILKSASLRGPAADVLRAIRAADGERVAAPWIVMEEIAAQQALAYQRKHDTAVEAVDILRAATPWSDVPNPRKWDAEHVRKHWRERYASLAETIETSPAAYQEAMFRETNLIAPCKTVNSGKHKTGARDAAIWLTAVEYARSNPAEIVYFVSNNTEDFGDGSSFPEPMDKDISGMEDRFFLFTSLDGILTKFATELEAGVEDIQSLLDTEETRAAILLAARAAARRYQSVDGSRLMFASEIADSDSDKLGIITQTHWRPTGVGLDKVLKVDAREVGGHHWFTASVRWLLKEERPRPEGYLPQHMAYAWETRILLSPTADKPLTVLDSKRPGPIYYADIPKVSDINVAMHRHIQAPGEWPTALPADRTMLETDRHSSPGERSFESEVYRLFGVWSGFNPSVYFKDPGDGLE
ncbi:MULTISPECIES: PIN domain-containing protein [unclassified Streptomyces]|uniref:PIN domain-containing protein n=2 Tax=Streptomyces TaxID=1883 RepID=UPI0037F67E5F